MLVSNALVGANPYCRLLITGRDLAWKPNNTLTGTDFTYDTGYQNTGVLNPAISNQWLIMPQPIFIVAGSWLDFSFFRDATDPLDIMASNFIVYGLAIV